MKLKINRLNFEKILELYYLFRPVLPMEVSQTGIKLYREIFDGIAEQNVEIFYTGMGILYKLDQAQVMELGEIKAINAFVDGLTKNQFFEFVLFVRKITDDG